MLPPRALESARRLQPVIFSAYLGVPLPYRPTFYAHLGLLHGSVALRVVGDLVDTLGRWRVWGGLLNAFALLFFILNTAGSIVVATKRASSAERPPHP